MTWVDFLSFCFSGSNFLYSSLFVVTVLYWVLVILGAFDFDLLELDLGSGESSALLGFFEWFNLGRVPVTILLSVAIIPTWVMGLYTSFLFPEMGAMLHNFLFIPFFICGLILAKFLTSPLKKVFAALGASANQAKNVGSIGVLTADLSPGELAQLEVKIEGSPMKVNVKLAGDQKLKKGQQAIVISKDQKEGNNIFLVEPFDDWEA